MSILTDISENLQRGKAKIVKELVQQAIDEGIPVQQILDEGLLSGMGVIGEKFKNNEVFVPEVLVAARAMNMGAQLLKPLMADAGVEAAGKVCIGTVKGDLHDIGKNLVRMMLEGKGLDVIDLGVDEFYPEEDGVTVYAPYESFGAIQKWLDDKGFEIVSGESVRIPTDTKELDAEGRESVEKLVEKLEEDDDVVNVYHTMKEPEEE